MFDTRPYALIVDRDANNRARLAAALREAGFVVAAFREARGALAALAARPVDLAVIADCATGDDAQGIARQMRHCRPATRVLFAGAANAIPTRTDEHTGGVAIQPFDKRRFLGAVFALLTSADSAAERRGEAEFGLMAARLACLRQRDGIFADAAVPA